eukprot:2807398-Pleurochrysis_carterae.AAC.1
MASLHYRSVRPSCRRSPSDEWDYALHSQNDGNAANHHPFPGHESNMPTSDLNQLAHQQFHVSNEKSCRVPIPTTSEITAPR